MGRQRLWTAATVIAGVLAMAAGCAQPVSPGSLPELALDHQSEPYGQLCDASNPFPVDAPPMEPLSADAELVRAMRCLFETERVPGDGEWIVRVDQEATAGLDELAAALRLPSEQPPLDAVCPAIAYLPVIITVADSDGRQFHPTIPTTGCGAPLPAVTDAIAALPWTTVATTRVGQAQSELAVTSGCPPSYKAVVALAAAEGTGTRASTVDTTARELSFCWFEAAPDAAALAARGELYVGNLVAASTLDSGAAHELLTAIDTAPPATQPCTEPSSFVVIGETDGTRLDLVVEVDGCYRAMLGEENYVRQLDPELVTRLFG